MITMRQLQQGEILQEGDVLRTRQVGKPVSHDRYFRPELMWKEVKEHPVTEVGKTFICLNKYGEVCTQVCSSDTWNDTITHWLCEIPKKSNRIDELLKEHGVSLNTAKIAALLASGKKGEVTLAGHAVIIHGDGSLKFGCQTFTAAEVAEFARAKGWV